MEKHKDTSIIAFVKKALDKQEPVKIIGFGDSITQGNIDTNGAWPQELQTKLEHCKPGFYQVLNKGINGNTTANGFDRFETDIISNLPCIVIIAFGINDCNHRAWAKVPRISVVDYEKNLREFHRVITSSKGCCIFVANHILQPLEGSRFLNQGNGKPYQENLEPYNTIVHKLSDELSVPLIDFPKYINQNSINVQSLLAEDGVHLSRYGYTLYTDYIFECLKAFGILANE